MRTLKSVSMMERDDANLNGDSCIPRNPNVRYVVICGITLLRSAPHPPAHRSTRCAQRSAIRSGLFLT